jgi:surfactin synthase thioesterase subunit
MPRSSPFELLCLPCAGGSAASYLRWRRQVPTSLHVQPVELPGRGVRSQQLCMESRRSLVARLVDELSGAVRAPYALFGHSLGGLLAFELAHALRARGLPEPTLLFIAASEAPALRNVARFEQDYSDAELKREMERLQGTPRAVLDDAELMDLALPVLRADFRLCRGQSPRFQQPLSCPIQVFGGVRDAITRHALLGWRAETSGPFSLHMLEADHFLVRSHERELLWHITRAAASALGAEPAAPALTPHS